MTGWAASELQFADLGDERRNKRLVQEGRSKKAEGRRDIAFTVSF